MPVEDSEPPPLPEKRVWAHDVAVGVEVLRTRLAVHEAAGLSPQRQAVADGVARLLDRAEAAAFRWDPQPTRLGNWWRGTLIEAAYQNMHAAEAEIVTLYDDDEVAAEVPEAVARVEAGLHRDDPRRRAARHLLTMPPGEPRRRALRKAVEVGAAAADRQHTRVRSFRNVVLVTALLLALLVVAFAAVAGWRPQALPLCFTPDDLPPACPSGATGPSSYDAAVVALVGALGGALAAAASIRNLRGTSTPYDMPVALSLLKVPAGALTALGALIAIRGNVVPGLSDLDSQEQVLAYGLVFGYAQQLLTRFIDERAGTVLNSIPSKDATVGRPELGEEPPDETPAPPAGPVAAASAPGVSVPPQTGPATAPDVLDDDEQDVLALVDTDPVLLQEGEADVDDDALLEEHFGPEDPHDPADVLEGVEYVDDPAPTRR